ncbi:hypothetical protein BLOT_004173 [Blomia tropicalis]|nr:hypothetical protein BLOT_004173 [Blomia tropicalis]
MTTLMRGIINDDVALQFASMNVFNLRFLLKYFVYMVPSSIPKKTNDSNFDSVVYDDDDDKSKPNGLIVQRVSPFADVAVGWWVDGVEDHHSITIWSNATT